jgi:hypothetical protein
MALQEPVHGVRVTIVDALQDLLGVFTVGPHANDYGESGYKYASHRFRLSKTVNSARNWPEE